MSFLAPLSHDAPRGELQRGEWAQRWEERATRNERCEWYLAVETGLSAAQRETIANIEQELKAQIRFLEESFFKKTAVSPVWWE